MFQDEVWYEDLTRPGGMVPEGYLPCPAPRPHYTTLLFSLLLVPNTPPAVTRAVLCLTVWVPSSAIPHRMGTGQCCSLLVYNGQCCFLLVYNGQCYTSPWCTGQCYTSPWCTGQCWSLLMLPGQCWSLLMLPGQCYTSPV